MKVNKLFSIGMVIVIFCFEFYRANGQGIGVNNPTPDASSILDVTSTDKGLLTPRMTTAQRIAIIAPATGLLVYDITLKAFYYYDGLIWKAVASGLSGWSITGNSGTSSLLNYLGTSDNQALVFKVNNLLSGFIDNQDGLYLGRNTFFGKEAGLNHTTDGYENTFVGFRSGLANTLGDFNTAVGSYTLLNLTTGYSNLALGAQAMMNATSSFQNCAVGIGALTNATTGYHNQAFGYHVMFATVTPGLGNHAFGFEVLLNNSGNYNSAFGQTALRLNTLGNLNCAFGSSALYNNTSGSNNVAVGELSLVNNTTGSNNVALGFRAAYSGVAAGRIIAIGDSALFANTTNLNMAVKSRALLK
ncbi:MAG: hypothetical protein IPP71_09750 [Bacteroidetes bacterium]|nr:hypothetical protein [Bacteroidota bacterium]